MVLDQQDFYIQQTYASLQDSLSRYTNNLSNYPKNIALQAAIKKELQVIKIALEKVNNNVVKIATFGLVSRGKSAIVNALVGQYVFNSEPVNGTTKWPKSFRWMPDDTKVMLEFIDTPGLDEINEIQNSTMSREVAEESDLILFVISEDIVETEYKALIYLKKLLKPIILVFNKIDLYPEKTCLNIYKQLQEFSKDFKNEEKLLINIQDIVLVAASPKTIPIKIRNVDGKVKKEVETQTPQIKSLRHKILGVVNNEGRYLLCLNVLLQVKQAEENIALKTIQILEKDAEYIIKKYVKYKSLIVTFNPIAVLDICIGLLIDLALIRKLFYLYALPITNHNIDKLWFQIFFSSGKLLLSEVFTGLVLSISKTIMIITNVLDKPIAIEIYGTSAILQGGIAAHSTYRISKAVQNYLAKSCSWRILGSSEIIENILNEANENMMIYSLRLK